MTVEAGVRARACVCVCVCVRVKVWVDPGRRPGNTGNPQGPHQKIQNLPKRGRESLIVQLCFGVLTNLDKLFNVDELWYVFVNVNEVCNSF